MLIETRNPEIQSMNLDKDPHTDTRKKMPYTFGSYTNGVITVKDEVEIKIFANCVSESQVKLLS
jgi:hypothetical protein